MSQRQKGKITITIIVYDSHGNDNKRIYDY
jgi:hypothetical protein